MALGDLLHGLPIDSVPQLHRQLLRACSSPSGCGPGVTLLVLSLLMGATYLTLKTDGELHDRVADGLGRHRLAWPSLVTFGLA